MLPAACGRGEEISQKGVQTVYLDASGQANLRNNEVNSIHLMHSIPRDTLQLHEKFPFNLS
jgi:hypothetical protein